MLAALALSSWPYAYGWAIRPPGSVFWAVPPVNSGDANQYLAFTRIVAEGSVLVGDPFTAEPHRPALFLPQVVLQGVMCRLFGWDPLLSFQATRVLSGALLLMAGWWLGTLVFARWRHRWLYLGLLCFSAGAGWVVDAIGLPLAHGDAFQPEGNTFATLANLAHLSLSAALLTFLFATVCALERGRAGRPAAASRRRWALLAATAIASALLSWTHPFDFVTLGLVLGAYGTCRWLELRRFPAVSAEHALALLCGALPAAVYLVWLTSSEPFYRALAADSLRVHGFWFYAVAHLPLALPALAVLASPELRRRCALPVCWAICVFLFLLTPFTLGGKQPRIVGGVHVALALLATAGVDRAARALARRWVRHKPDSGARPLLLGPAASRDRAAQIRAARGAIVGALCGGYLVVASAGTWAAVERHAAHYRRREPDFFIQPAVSDMYRLLRREDDPSQLTLGGAYTGGWAPTWADTRVYHGHWHMTLDAERKAAERLWFYTAPAAPAERAAWLRRNDIDWVIRYPWEWKGLAVPLDGVPGLRAVFRSPEVVLYRFSG